jgi:hypothetical protein
VSTPAHGTTVKPRKTQTKPRNHRTQRPQSGTPQGSFWRAACVLHRKTRLIAACTRGENGLSDEYWILAAAQCLSFVPKKELSA